MTNTKQVKSSELRNGDVVWTDGLRVKIGSVTEHLESPLVYTTRGTILNWDELDVDTQAFIRNANYGRDPLNWNIQGNDRATWTVEQ